MLIILGSCGEDWAFKEETFLVAPENDNWVPTEVNEESFIMTDTFGISYGYILDREEYYLDKSWGGYFGLTTHMSHTEYRSRSYTSTYGADYSISIRAATWEPYGDELRIEVNDLVFRYDLALDKVSDLYTPFYSNSYTQTSEGYEYDEEIVSSCVVIDSFKIGERTFEDVLQFTLLDQPDKWGPHIPVNIYISKGVGLIMYTLNNGIEFRLLE